MNDPRLIVLISFLASIFISRSIIFILDKTNRLKQVRPHLKSFEVHHLTSGLIILIIAGYLSITNQFVISKTALSILYGFGLGLVIDELWVSSVILNKHWHAEGIEYYKLPTYLIIIMVVILLIVLTIS
ncbi:hypothetical protein HY385_01940 [Candidatus Daviesbacteria bacterium]|nr:hypothetical protein [Candidatus Daviesbacteria bacterium]